ncbi:MAG TPA: DUF4965 domain-containing protein [Acidobacteriaceae bacterium]|nr:DUF4965 domain-containing protein [Acidobacteriaceae bacterium]
MRSVTSAWFSIVLCGLLSSALGVFAQTRPPATPLITHDPYFSVWSMTDTLTGSNTRHWTGTEQPFTGLVRIDGHVFRWMGRDPDETLPLQQLSSTITPTHTVYKFEASGVHLTVTFFTPALLQNLDILSRPVTYLTWQAQATDGHAHKVTLYLDVSPLIAVNIQQQKVIWGRQRTQSLQVLSVGTSSQNVLHQSGDDMRIDWGYFHLAIPTTEQAFTSETASARDTFLRSGTLPVSDDMDMPLPADQGAALLAVALPLGNVTAVPVTRHVLVSYTDNFSIEFLHRRLRPYWQRNGLTTQAMLNRAEAQYGHLDKQATAFDKEITADLQQTGGADYAYIAILAYRQAIAAHKLVADIDGTPLFFAKENFSNGCISTVDVMYPSAPIFLLLNPRLLEAQIRPVLEYAALPRWPWPFAPHDLGRYPLANGQVYGGGERSEIDQMPIEESGNLLILVDALSRAEGNTNLAEQYWPQLTKWAEYLRRNGLDPKNQLSTDDFAGHLAHNANLSIKAIEALDCYADLARRLHKNAIAQQYASDAQSMVPKWIEMDQQGDHYKLAFDQPGTWSQKYNLVWDKILDLHLFPAKVHNAELAFYQTKLNLYGLPLDSRADYTKLDWEIWTATLADTQTQFQAFIAPIYKWVNEGPSRVPLTDWYDTKTGKQIGFQARSVVGGVFIKALADKTMAQKWQQRALHSPADTENVPGLDSQGNPAP